MIENLYIHDILFISDDICKIEYCGVSPTQRTILKLTHFVNSRIAQKNGHNFNSNVFLEKKYRVALSRLIFVLTFL